MKRSLSFAALAALVGLAGSVYAQQLAVPGGPVARDVPGAKELPDPNRMYKVVFDIGKASPKPDQVSPGLMMVARYVNTLAKWGVPADHRKIAVILHQGGEEMIFTNEANRRRTEGHDNPNIDMIQKLTKAGVSFRVCGQGVTGKKIDRSEILPEIEVDLWAMVAMVNLQLEGYVHIGPL
ncbi:MAG: DsrE family protein [Bryobacteraceae bacterium]|jgi:intracellular sulfur oxidation DsrE/DsrF family protein